MSDLLVRALTGESMTNSANRLVDIALRVRRRANAQALQLYAFAQPLCMASPRCGGPGTKASLLIGLGVLAGLLGPTVASAQMNDAVNAPGLHPHRGYLSGEPSEYVDPTTGALFVKLTPLVLPGNGGHSLQIVRTFNSKAGGAERFGIAGMVLWLDDNQWANLSQNADHGAILYTAEGGSSKAVIQLVGSSDRPTARRTLMTDSFWVYDRMNKRLYKPDGSIMEFTSIPARPSWSRLSRYLDPHGNEVTLAWQDHALTITQKVESGIPRVITLTNPVDGRDTTEVLWAPTAMTYAGRPWTFGYPSTNPEGPDWSYEQVPGTFPVAYVARLLTPYGGWLEYRIERREFLNPGDPPERTVVTDLVTSRTVYNMVSGSTQAVGTTNYQYEMDTSLLSGTTTVQESNRTTVFTFGSTLVDTHPYHSRSWALLSRTVSEAGAELEKEVRTYQRLQVPSAGSSLDADPDGFPGLTSVTVTRSFPGNASQTNTTLYCYGSADFGDYHRPNKIIESGGRTTKLRYAHSEGKPVIRSDTWTPEKFFLGLPVEETTIQSAAPVTSCAAAEPGGASTTKSWKYDVTLSNPPADLTGFRLSETVSGITTYFTSDRGNVRTTNIGNRLGRTTTYHYKHGQVERIDTPQHSTARSVKADGTLESETTADRTTTYVYDDAFRLHKVTPPGASNPTTITHDMSARTVTTDRGPASTVVTLDGFGRTIHTLNGAGIATRTTYDTDGRVTFASRPYIGTNSNAGTTFGYDALGRVKFEQERNEQDQVVADRAYAYGPNTVTITDTPLDEPRNTVYTYQSFGHPDAKRLVQLEDAEGKVWKYVYNVRGDLEKMTASDDVQRTWVYNDTTHLLERETHPESGTTLYDFDEVTGLLLQKQDANGIVYTYHYDTNDRLEQIDAGPVSSPQQRVTTITYEANSDNLATMSVAGVTTTFGYDPATGRLASRQDVVDGKSFFSSYTYTGNDSLKTITYPTGRTVVYSHDSEDRILTVSSAGQLLASEITYHPSGGIREYRAGSGAMTTIDYDPAQHRIERIRFGLLFDATVDLQYAYDTVGNVRQIVSSHGPTQTYTETFTYDRLDRLKSVRGGPAPADFNYDVHGNQEGPWYAQDNPFRLLQVNGLAVEYHPGGNLKKVGSDTTYDWEPGTLLKQVQIGGTTSQFGYDADDWRVKKVVNGGVPTYFIRGPGGELLTQWQNTSPSAEARDYIYLGSRLIAGARVNLDPR